MTPGRSPSEVNRRWGLRTYILYAAAAVLGLVAVALRSPVPLFLALPLLLAPLAASGLVASHVPSARLEWEASGGGSAVIVAGNFHLDRTVEYGDLVPVFAMPEPLQTLARPEVVRERRAVRFRIQCQVDAPCLVQIPVPQLLWRDPWALVESAVRVGGAPLDIDRFPPELRRLDRIRLVRTTPFPGEIRSRAVGRTGEFFSVRPATAQDSVRQINWKATARAAQLLANDYQLERTGDVLLLIDVRPSGLGPGRDAQLLSVSRAAVYGLAIAFLAQKTRVGLGVFTDQLEVVPLGTGRLQRYRISAVLRHAEVPLEGGPPERLAISVRRYFPPGVFSILVSPLLAEDSRLVLPHLRRRGFPTLVLSPSPIPLLGRPPESPEDWAAIRLIRLLRRRELGETWREAPVIDWEDYWSLEPLVNFLRRPLSFARRS